MKKAIIRVPNKNYTEKFGVLDFYKGEATIEGDNYEAGIDTAKSFGYEIEIVEEKPKAAAPKPKAPRKTATKSEDK